MCSLKPEAPTYQPTPGEEGIEADLLAADLALKSRGLGLSCAFCGGPLVAVEERLLHMCSECDAEDRKSRPAIESLAGGLEILAGVRR